MGVAALSVSAGGFFAYLAGFKQVGWTLLVVAFWVGFVPALVFHIGVTLMAVYRGFAGRPGREE